MVPCPNSHTVPELDRSAGICIIVRFRRGRQVIKRLTTRSSRCAIVFPPTLPLSSSSPSSSANPTTATSSLPWTHGGASTLTHSQRHRFARRAFPLDAPSPPVTVMSFDLSAPAELVALIAACHPTLETVHTVVFPWHLTHASSLL